MALKFGSPAWQAKYNPRVKKAKRKVYKQPTVRVSMAKKRSKARSSSKGFSNGLGGQITGAAGYILYETYVSPRIPVNGIAKSLLELGLGVYLARKGGIVGSAGKTAVVLNTYQLMKGFIAPILGSVATGNGLSTGGMNTDI